MINLLKKKQGGFKRRGLFTKFKGGACAAETLQQISVGSTFTPNKDRFICDTCNLTIKSLGLMRQQLEEVEEKFRKIRKPGSYISSKIQSSPSNRRTPKKHKVISSPARKIVTPKASSCSDKIYLKKKIT